MTYFFPDLKSLHDYTLTLDAQHRPPICSRCKQDNQFVSHGFVYKPLNQGKRQITGKRLFCSDRSGRTGCGSTCQLYVSQTLPSFQHNALHLFIFLSALMLSLSIKEAYLEATGNPEPRNAYRWLNKLQHKLIDYRAQLTVRTDAISNPFKVRTKRLELLLCTLSALFLKLNQSPCAHYQTLTQSAFI